MGKFVVLFFVTLLPLHVILKPSSIDYYDNFEDTTQYFEPLSTPKTVAYTTTLRTTTTTAKVENTTAPNFSECGIMSSPSGLIQKGNFSKITEFPWMATIVDHMHADGTNSSGALISTKHVLTRGKIFPHWSDWRLMWNLNHIINSDDLSMIEVYLGSLHHISDENIYGIDHVHLQPDRKKIKEGVYYNNLAIIRLKTIVEFSDVIRPVCVWPDEHVILSDVPIYAVGYGRDASGNMTNVRKYTKVNYHSSFTEFGDTLFSIRNNKRIEVTGSETGSSCEFDEMLFIKYNGIWYLRGILAEDFRFNNKTCNSDTTFVYEDVSQHIEWIEEKIDE